MAEEIIEVPPGKMGEIVTSLEMFERPAPRPEPAGLGLSLTHVRHPDPDWYLALFRRVGADWLWTSRVEMPRARLVDIIQDPLVEVHVPSRDGVEVGLLELDFREPGVCELGFFGLTPEAVGQGAGRWLMNRALDLAWSRPIRRFWVHTCTHDHPAALPFYMRSGFVAFRRHVEIGDDPRVTGALPRTAAPQFPIL